jgi:hypothetical protein
MKSNVYTNHLKKSIMPEVLACIMALTSVLYFEGKTKLETVEYFRTNLNIKLEDFNKYYLNSIEIIFDSLVNTENN